MVAGIEIKDGRASMFYAGEVPWHGLGTRVPDAVTAEEATRLAGLDWQVEVRPIYGPTRKTITRYAGITRSTDGHVLGIVRRDGVYEPIQNSEAVDFMDSLVADRTLRYHTAGFLEEKSMAWYLAEIPGDVRIGDDEYEQYLLASVWHDGVHALTIHSTSVRVVCGNTWTAATSAKAALARIRHTRTKDDQMTVAREIINATTAEQRRMMDWLRQLNETPVTTDQIVAVRDTLFGPLDLATPAARAKAIDEWNEIFIEEKDRVGRTAYALANAATGFADHKLKFGSESSRFMSTVQGRASMFKNVAIDAIEKVTGVVRI